MGDVIRILAINPGSTSTKVALFDNENKIFNLNVTHDAKTLEGFDLVRDQLPYRRDMILEALKNAGFALEDITAFAGRGGGVNPCGGGTYPVNDLILEHTKKNSFHPATLGASLADGFAKIHGKKAFIVNPPDVDELEPISRVSGIAGVERKSSFHALSHKEAGLRAAAQLGKSYSDVNLVIAHIGGGTSVAAHKKGRVVDASDLLHGDAPMAPTRAGQIAPGMILNLHVSGNYGEKRLRDLFLKNGGMVDLLGTSDVLEVKKRIAEGDRYAELVYKAMIYQVGKSIGAFAAVLHGDVDALVFTGGLAQDEDLVGALKDMVGYIAEVIVYPGEFEMEALAYGALRVLRGEEKPVEYAGEPVWSGFDQYKTKKG